MLERLGTDWLRKEASFLVFFFSNWNICQMNSNHLHYWQKYFLKSLKIWSNCNNIYEINSNHLDYCQRYFDKGLKTWSNCNNIWYLNFKTFYWYAKLTDTSLCDCFQSNSRDVTIKCYCHNKNLHSICKLYNKMLIDSFMPKYNMAKAMIGIIILISISWYQSLVFELQSNFWWK